MHFPSQQTRKLAWNNSPVATANDADLDLVSRHGDCVDEVCAKATNKTTENDLVLSKTFPELSRIESDE